ncbi:hypothetical protein ARMSODRAFT_1026643 [Armillaria solidipes]|uniref:Uncharacterized protein n=1 Tax=Armillaria solidipes TaxID=1076256 RepID=A0A2H3BBD7_9AGAR|nr:hypothetical protein ARMSODRAFT_1026643 [Armillaria solidipes]
MALFVDADLLSHAEYNVLKSYMKDLILYDPPFVSLSIEVPDDANPYDLWVDPKYQTMEEMPGPLIYRCILLQVHKFLMYL